MNSEVLLDVAEGLRLRLTTLKKLGALVTLGSLISSSSFRIQGLCGPHPIVVLRVPVYSARSILRGGITKAIPGTRTMLLCAG